MYASLGYPSFKGYKWVIQSNQIKDFPVRVQDIDVAHNIWVNSVPGLKLKTTRKKHIPVGGNMVKVPEDLLKLHKDIYLTADLLFVNGIPFFFTVSRNIYFIDASNLSKRKWIPYPRPSKIYAAIT